LPIQLPEFLVSGADRKYADEYLQENKDLLFAELRKFEERKNSEGESPNSDDRGHPPLSI